ncbi:hypothetical protein GUITHDRAFT_150265 [Guillardia theta CCMP2712]|uniref:Uncharacterized protein n=1 Tax=Guillardia theta (strain CCMP2712) TaxID=905079 RepID=L1JYP4_GUITC|nr:hypothetical protein GUITHDRAFT_150265 [Guillardia theta CCMP2712]EKX53701.1 hypothetical protein GUITHDRAFT_150265 [Guillardia theta CCMP2712]|eukprot:XP_005840681.1 hypothetical protein GUITHDRAFT_150265 [Guillardia theta CCMP2712]
MVNSTKSSSVQSSDYYSINLKYLDWSRKRIKETVILVSPAEPTRKVIEFVLLSSKRMKTVDHAGNFKKSEPSKALKALASSGSHLPQTNMSTGERLRKLIGWEK